MAKPITYVLNVLFIFILLNSTYAQQEDFYIIGENELTGKHIYDILETKNEVLFFATNEGLFKYQNGECSEIPQAKKQKGTDCFELKELPSGEIVWNNLLGQWFSYLDGKTTILFELPSNSLGKFPKSVIFENQIWVAGKSITSFGWENKKLITHYQPKNPTNYSFSVGITDDLLQFYRVGNDSLFYWNGSKLIKHKVNRPISPAEASNTGNVFVTINNTLYWQINSGVYSLDFKQKIPIESKSIEVISNEEIWTRSSSGRITKYWSSDEIWQSQNYFSNRFISRIVKTQSGVYLLGTFGNGVIVFDNDYSVLVSNENPSTKITSFTMIRDRLFSVSNNGNVLLTYSGTTKRIAQYGNRLDNIFSFENSNFHINKKFPFLLYGSRINKKGSYYGYGVVKDICSNSNGDYFFVSPTLGVKSNRKLNFKLWQKSNSGYPIYYNTNPLLDTRFDCIEFFEENQTVLLSNSDGLIEVDSTGNIKELKFQNNSIEVNSMEKFLDFILLGTEKNGILIYQKNGIKPFQPLIEWSENKTIDFVGKRGDYLIVRSNTQTSIFDVSSFKLVFETDLFTGYNKANKKSIFINEGFIYGLRNGKVVSTKILSNNEYLNFQLYISSIKIGGKNFKDKIQVSSNQNNVFLQYDVRNLKFQNADIYYRLIGTDTLWEKTKSNYRELKFNFLPAGKYTIEIFAKKGNVRSEIQSFSFEILPPFYFTWWFILCLILLLLSIIYILWKARMQFVLKKQNKIFEKQQLISALQNSQLKSLRSQMNPHFIFNSLSSIQDLVIKNETILANDYLVDFSRMLRDILSNSESDFIPIQKEIEFLESYLSLEQSRFKKNFEYQIENKAPQWTKIPSMLVQPFVENSIQHGLIHKEGLKKIQISFFVDDNQLVCKIQDNGIGREQSKKIKESDLVSIKESFSTRATKERVKLINEQYKVNATFEIIDLLKDEKPNGTLIILKTPINYA